jgi:hypothetical protein
MTTFDDPNREAVGLPPEPEPEPEPEAETAHKAKR